MKNSNQINVPQAREAMDKFKMAAAQDVDGPVTYLNRNRPLSNNQINRRFSKVYCGTITTSV